MWWEGEIRVPYAHFPFTFKYAVKDVAASAPATGGWPLCSRAVVLVLVPVVALALLLWFGCLLKNVAVGRGQHTCNRLAGAGFFFLLFLLLFVPCSRMLQQALHAHHGPCPVGAAHTSHLHACCLHGARRQRQGQRQGQRGQRPDGFPASSSGSSSSWVPCWQCGPAGRGGHSRRSGSR